MSEKYVLNAAQRRQAVAALEAAKKALHTLEREFYADQHPTILRDMTNEVERWTHHFKTYMVDVTDAGDRERWAGNLARTYGFEKGSYEGVEENG